MDCNTTQINEGLNGFNTYTYTTATFVIPAINNATPVTINVSNVRPSTGVWAAAGSYLFIAGNYFLVVSSTENTITVTNPQTSIFYTTNQAPGSVIPSNSLVITTGPQGPPTTITFPRSSKMLSTSSFSQFILVSTGYQTLTEGNIDDILTVNGDCLEILFTTISTGTSFGPVLGFKSIINGQLLHEITTSGGDEINGYIFNKITIVRKSATNLTYFSEMSYGEDLGPSIKTNADLIVNRMFKKAFEVSVGDVTNLNLEFMADITGLGDTISPGLLIIKFTPYDN